MKRSYDLIPDSAVPDSAELAAAAKRVAAEERSARRSVDWELRRIESYVVGVLRGQGLKVTTVPVRRPVPSGQKRFPELRYSQVELEEVANAVLNRSRSSARLRTAAQVATLLPELRAMHAAERPTWTYLHWLSLVCAMLPDELALPILQSIIASKSGEKRLGPEYRKALEIAEREFQKEPPPRMGDVILTVVAELSLEESEDPAVVRASTSFRRVRRWLSEASAKGLLKIPAASSKAGAPKRRS